MLISNMIDSCVYWREPDYCECIYTGRPTTTQLAAFKTVSAFVLAYADAHISKSNKPPQQNKCMPIQCKQNGADSVHKQKPSDIGIKQQYIQLSKACDVSAYFYYVFLCVQQLPILLYNYIIDCMCANIRNWNNWNNYNQLPTRYCIQILPPFKVYVTHFYTLRTSMLYMSVVDMYVLFFVMF